MEKILEKCDSPHLVSILIPATSGLVAEIRIEMIDRLGNKIEHVHWKDLSVDFEEKRGQMYGCGMGLVALGRGVIGIENIFKKLIEKGFDGYSTLEVAGEQAVLESYQFLKSLGAE